MRVKDLKDLRDIKDLKEVNREDVVELLDELRVIATKGANELLGTGKKSARRAIGAPSEGAVTLALIGGIVAGVIVGALMALVLSPFSAGEARQRLVREVDRVRERLPEQGRGNGRGMYPHEEPETQRSPSTGMPETSPS